MKGDFSRFALDPGAYSRVLMQQGRVLVDSDWNDHVAMTVASQRAMMADLVGPHGGPSGQLGFKVAPVTTEGKADLAITPGAYYVDGARVVNPGGAGAVPAPSLYLSQPYRGSAGAVPLPAPPYLVYLDVWERHVTALEDGQLREPALGGPDTTSRAQVVWQVRVQPLVDAPWKPFAAAAVKCANFDVGKLRALLVGNLPRLKARAKEADDVADDPCLSSPESRYRGAGNQLYRVEIHAVEPDGVTFVWSRENGSVVAEWLDTEGDVLRVAGIRDKVRGFEGGDWVELVDDRLELGSQAGVLVRLARVDRDRLTVDATTATGPILNPATLVHPRVRRWDQRQVGTVPLVGGAMKVRTGTAPTDWINLEAGIQVQFQSPPPGVTDDFRVGDHWVLPARVAGGDLLWPRDTDGHALAVPPHGVEHHYAPLAIVPAGGGAAPPSPLDLRRQFGPLATCLKA